jgi:hypothetical protein
MMDWMSWRSRLHRSAPWLFGFLAFLWVLLRSGANPRRLTYPCQRAALPVAANWILAVIAFFGGSLLFRRVAKYSGALVLTGGVLWLTFGIISDMKPDVGPLRALPTWEVEDPVSSVFVMDSIPPTSGSLAPGDTTVPDEYLPDPTIDTLLLMLKTRGTPIHRTDLHPGGIAGPEDVVVIKGNFQWNSWNTTSTDRIKGLIWRILCHPDGFTGEILVCDNTQDIGTGINHNDNNSEDPEQSILDVVSTFHSKGHPVYTLDWNSFWAVVANEYSEGDFDDGYVYENDTKISYPKFRSPSGDHLISLKYGLYDSTQAVYDSSRLCIIDFPVLKAHSWAGATIAVKNWIGTLTTAHSSQRYGGFNNMHNYWFFGTYALVARVLSVTYPRLTIVDAAWTTTYGPNNLTWVEQTNMIAASTDPVAASWYTAKFILTPIARYPSETDPDLQGSDYERNLRRWNTYLSDSLGYPCTRDSTEISVYDVPLSCGDANGDADITPSDGYQILNFFGAGSAPESQWTADTNCDGILTPSDAYRVMNYLGSTDTLECC